MPAPEGNKNAEKWTIEASEKFLNEIYQYVLDNDDCCSLSEACSKLGWYEKVFCYIQEKHENVDFDPIKKAKELIKQRIIKKGLESKYNPTMSIFILKCNHEMIEGEKREDKKDTTITLNFGNKSLTIEDLKEEDDS